MKKKVLITSILMSFAIVACGDAKTTIADVPQEQVLQEQEQDQEVKQEKEETQEEKEVDMYSIEGKDYGSFFLFNEPIDVGYVADRTGQDVFWHGDVVYSFDYDVPFYDVGDRLAGYIKKGETVPFMNRSNECVGFHVDTDVEDYVNYKIKFADIEEDDSSIFMEQVLASEGQKEMQEYEDNREEWQIAASIFWDAVGSIEGAKSDYKAFPTDDKMDTSIMVNIPWENTQEWANEKRDLFIENGITTYNIEGYGYFSCCSQVLLQLKNDEKIFTREELEQFFQNDVDLELKRILDEEYQQYLEQQKNNS